MRTSTTVTASLTLLTLMFAVAPSQARIHRSWNYEELTEQAELIVVVRPLATRATGTRAALPNISSTDSAGKTTPVSAERVATTLTVVAVLKGKLINGQGRPSSTIVLHHYREAPNTVSLNGPQLVSFEPKLGTQYLMFLTRGKDGQYVAVSGQTDPVYSVEKLRMSKH